MTFIPKSQIEKVHRYHSFLRWSMIIFGVVFCAMGVFLVFYTAMPEWFDGAKEQVQIPKNPQLQFAINMGLGIFSVVMGFFSAYEFAIGKVTLKGTEYRARNCLGHQTFDLKDYASYAINEYGAISLTPKPGGLAKTRYLELKYYARSHEILRWIKAELPEAEDRLVVEEKQELAQNSEIGRLPEERESRLNQGRKIAWALNIAGGAALLAALSPIGPGNVAITAVVMTIPWICVAAIHFAKGAIYLDGPSTTKIPKLFPLYLMASLVGLLRALFDYDLQEWQNIWLPTVVLAMALRLVTFRTAQELERLKGTKIFVTVFASLWAFSTTLNLNAWGPNQSEQTYESKVLETKISHNKMLTQKITMTPWGPQTNPTTVTFDLWTGSKFEANAEIQVTLINGTFAIPYATYKPKPTPE